jgi:hypothetical protein
MAMLSIIPTRLYRSERRPLNFAGALMVCEQNRLLSFCFGLSQGIKRETEVDTAYRATYARVCDGPLKTAKGADETSSAPR